MKTPAFTIETPVMSDERVIEQMIDLIRDAFTDWHETRDASRTEVLEAFEPDRTTLIARSTENGDVLGWVGSIPVYDHAWELHPLVVRADTRGMGVGQVLVETLEERARAAGMLTLYLGTDDDGPEPGTSAGGVDLWPEPLAHAVGLVSHGHAVGFYRRLGYVVVGLLPDANGPGKPDILMAKALTRPA